MKTIPKCKGKLTSKLRDVWHTAADSSQQSISFIQLICYSALYKFTSVACQYGYDYENMERDKYSKVHESFLSLNAD